MHGLDPAQRFTSVFQASYGAIYAYAVRRVGRQAADEVAAETFLVAWRRMDSLPTDPLPWLYGIARNIVARHYTSADRQRRTEVALARAPLPHSTPEPPDSSDPELWEAWEQLGPGDREVLSLVAWEDLRLADAARVLGCPAPVFSVRLHRARRRLERLLASRQHTPIPSTELSEA
jgi:RNA polymerase sigma-70 factor (ECF subfamily)